VTAWELEIVRVCPFVDETNTTEKVRVYWTPVFPPIISDGKLATPPTVVTEAPEMTDPSVPEIETVTGAPANCPWLTVFWFKSFRVTVGASPVFPAGAVNAAKLRETTAGSERTRI
jgi:hypothetical protein